MFEGNQHHISDGPWATLPADGFTDQTVQVNIRQGRGLHPHLPWKPANLRPGLLPQAQRETDTQNNQVLTLAYRENSQTLSNFIVVDFFFFN